MKRLLALILIVLCGIVLTSCSLQSKTTINKSTKVEPTIESLYEKWKKSSESFDYSEDGIINEEDYKIYLQFDEWLDSSNALDINGDKKVNYEDYKLYIEFNKWKKSELSFDFNEDKKITSEDYYIYCKYLKWLETNEASDLNDDSDITPDDYLVYLSSSFEDYKEWKAGNNAFDFNKDNNISFIDYEMYLLYEEWLSKAINLVDYDENNVINENDFIIYKLYMSWLDSESSHDYTKDNRINYLDYKEYQEYVQWLNLEDSGDYDNDGSITYNDYLEFHNYQKWIESVDSMDLNKDMKVDYLDYMLYQQMLSVYSIPEGGYDGSEVTITFYHTMSKYTLQPVLEAYIEEFNKIYPKIHISHKAIGGYDDVRDQILHEIATDSQPNIAYCYSEHVVLYNLSGSVVPLDGFIASNESDGNGGRIGLTESQKNDFISGFYEEGRQFGDEFMYTMPFSKSTEVLYYNETFFTANNLSVPTHWFSTDTNDTTSMEYVVKRIKEIDPKSTPLGVDSEANWFITMCEQYHSPYTSIKEGEDHFQFNNDQNKQFVKAFREWHQAGLVTTQKIYGSYTSGLFVETDANKAHSYMSIGSSTGATHQRPKADRNGNYPFNVGIANIPQINVNDPKVISQGPSVCIFNKANAQEVVASWLFVKFLTTSVDFQAEFSMASGYVPVIKSVKDNAVYAAFLAKADGGNNVTALSAKICLEQANAYYTSPAFNGSSAARDQVGALMQKVMVEQTIDVDTMINEAFSDAIDECKKQTTVVDDTNDVLSKAASYVFALYKDTVGIKINGFDLLNFVKIGDKKVTLTWALSVTDENGTAIENSEAVTLTKKNEAESTVYVGYYEGKVIKKLLFNLIPSFSLNGITKTLIELYGEEDATNYIFKYSVDPLILGNRAGWDALANDKETSINIKGTVLGVLQDGSSKGSFYVQDEEGFGYYAYRPINAVTSDGKFNVKAGDIVVVSGTRLDYSGHQEFKQGCTFKVIGSNGQPTILDASADWAAATSNTGLDPKYQNNYVKLENCKAVAIPADGETEFLFTVGEGTVQWSIYDCYYFLTTEQRDAFKAAWAQAYNDGATFTVEGIVFPYLNEYQIYGATFKPEIIALTIDGVNE